MFYRYKYILPKAFTVGDFDATSDHILYTGRVCTIPKLNEKLLNDQLVKSQKRTKKNGSTRLRNIIDCTYIIGSSRVYRYNTARNEKRPIYYNENNPYYVYDASPRLTFQHKDRVCTRSRSLSGRRSRMGSLQWKRKIIIIIKI